MDQSATIVLFVLGLVTALICVQAAWGLYYSKPREFTYGDMVFVWVPEEGEEAIPWRHFFRRHYRFGSFQYADGSPVADPQTERMLREAWLTQNRWGNRSY